MHKVSIILPVYNSEKYVGEAIQSLLDQTYRNFELILINDGSTDNSINIMRQFKDDRIVILENEENSGIVFSLNKGIDNAKGEFIARMDADDIALKNRLEIQVDFLIANPEVDLIGSNFQNFGTGSETSCLFLNDEEIKLGLYFNNQLQHPTVLMRKSSIIKNKLYYNKDFFINQDWVMWYDCVQKGLIVKNIPEVLLKYRLEGQNITTNNYNTEKERQIKVYKHILPTLFDNIDDDLLELHWALSRGQVGNVKLDDLTRYSKRVKIVLMEKGFDYSLVNRFIKQKNKIISFRIIDKSVFQGIKYSVKNKVFSGQIFRYIIGKIKK